METNDTQFASEKLRQVREEFRVEVLAVSLSAKRTSASWRIRQNTPLEVCG